MTLRKRNGFTLIEILIVVAISAMLSAIAIVYSSVARNEVALSVETAKIAGFIFRAKDLTIATYNTSLGTCAYGVSFDIPGNTYSLFAYNPQNYPPSHSAAPPCHGSSLASTSPIYADEIGQYSENTWNVPVTQGVRMQSGGNGDDATIVLFYPPAPKTFISREGMGFGSANFLDPNTPPNTDITSKVYLSTIDGSASSIISVNGAGQVTF